MRVPTISLAAYHRALESAGTSSGDAEEREAAVLSELLACECVEDERAVGLTKLVEAVRSACEDVGFFVVVDHGIDEELLERQRRECDAFFARPPQSVVLGMVRGAASRFAWLDFVPPPEEEEAQSAGRAAAWSLGPVEGRGSMPWQPDSEALSSTWAAYYSAMERLVASLMQLFALALGLPARAFRGALRGHRSSMRALLYSEVAEHELEAAGGTVTRSAEHTDWGCVTVLLPDTEVGGLEVCGKDGAWSPVLPQPGGLVVNLGDLLPCWTRGRWVATPHRVVATRESRRRRLSVPYFGLVNRSTVLAPLVQLPADGLTEGLQDGEDPCSRPLTAGEFFDHHEEYLRRQRASAGSP
mmetsp:Transcript_86028/g.238319  ORF Transcript_86028/g.238319 Transcript_86028/m.238319 type:complete len:357 (-) Transcript_86028:99-1169(-)